MGAKVRPERCPFCAARTQALYVLETTPTHGARFVEVEEYVGCENGGIVGFSGHYLVDGRPSFVAMHPNAAKLLREKEEWR